MAWRGRPQRRVDEALDLVGLREHAGERIETYSGGMRRRINIAVGLLHRPSVVFMDEPTVGIDPQSRRNILDTVKALNQQGRPSSIPPTTWKRRRSSVIASGSSITAS